MAKYFDGIKTLAELKKAFRKYALKFHPDCGGDKKEFIAMNNEYVKIFDKIKNFEFSQKSDDDKQKAKPYMDAQNVNDGFRDIINILVKMKNIEIEICGLYVWVSGDTKQYKDDLKNAGCRWASKKGRWYWRPAECPSMGRGTWSMDKIRSRYGSEFVKAEDPASGDKKQIDVA